MAITFPRPIPVCAFTNDCSFVLKRQQSQALTGGGSPNVAEVGPAMWRAKYSTRLLTRAAFAEFDAWVASLRGGLRTFKGAPTRHRWPMAYPKGFAGLLVGANPFTGSGTLNTIGAGRDTVTVADLPVGFVLGVGDWFSIPVGTKQRLHRILEGGTASGLGAVGLTVEPIIDPSVTAGAVPVLFDGPWCDMVLASEADVIRDPVRGGSISFEGAQVLI